MISYSCYSSTIAVVVLQASLVVPMYAITPNGFCLCWLVPSLVPRPWVGGKSGLGTRLVGSIPVFIVLVFLVQHNCM